MRQLLDRHLPGWQSWQLDGINGEGIWSINYGQVQIANGLCNIHKNGVIIAGGQNPINLDSLIFNPGDRITIVRSATQEPVWDYQLPDDRPVGWLTEHQL